MRGSTKLFWAVLMAIMMSNVPHIALAEGIVKQEMIPTMAVVDALSREQTQSKVEEFLSREDVRSELIKRGVTPGEVTERLASLSDYELRQLAGQMQQATYGGDIGGILILVVLVLLIIFLPTRI